MSHDSSDDATGRNTLHLVGRFHDAFNRHDVDAIMALMTEDCVFENTYPPPDGTRIQGSDAVRAYWQKLFQQSPQAHFALEDIFACADRAVLRWRYDWHAVDGAVGYVRGIDIFCIRNGKMAEKLSYVKG